MTKEQTELTKQIDAQTFIISDLHLGHKNITKFEPHRLALQEEGNFKTHEQWLVNVWNTTIGEDDLVVCLGDFAFNGIKEYSKKLKGRKILILGNHDRQPYHEGYSEWVVLDGVYIHEDDTLYKIQDYQDDVLVSALITDINDYTCLLSHYPVFDNNAYDRKNKKISTRTSIMEDLYTKFGCDINLHGHTHSKQPSFKNCINTSLESINYAPQRIHALIN